MEDWSPEVYRIRDASMMAFIVGACLGGFGRSRIAYMDFFRRNAATQFETPLQAKSALQDQVSMGMASGAWRVGWRLTAFTFIYM
jgi:complex I assembly factor TIMMDC1